MEHFVKMPNLPQGIAFPPEFAEKIRHDPQYGVLVYQGFMSKADFDKLSRLSDNWSYKRPLEELFRLCMVEDRKPSVFRRLASALGTFGF